MGQFWKVTRTPPPPPSLETLVSERHKHATEYLFATLLRVAERETLTSVKTL